MAKQRVTRPRRPKAPERGAKLLDTNSAKDRFLWLIEGGKWIVADVKGGTQFISDAPTAPQIFATTDGAM